MGQGKSDASLSSTELEAIWGSLAKVLFSKTDTHTLVTKGNPVRLSGGGKLSVFELKKKKQRQAVEAQDFDPSTQQENLYDFEATLV